MNGKGYYPQNSTRQNEAYKRAVRRVQARMGFQQHIIAYLLGNTLLVLIYLLTQVMPGFPAYPWFIWPILGWSLALIFHFMEVFVFSESRTRQTRQRLIERELQHEVEAEKARI